jgi:enoyl-CoA hydratase
VYTGRVVDGRNAVEMGLALQCLPVEDLLDRAMAFAGVLAARAPVSVAFAKDFLQHSPNRTMREALDLEAGAILACMETDDWQEGLRAFAEKRNPDFRGS